MSTRGLERNERRRGEERSLSDVCDFQKSVVKLENEAVPEVRVVEVKAGRSAVRSAWPR